MRTCPLASTVIAALALTAPGDLRASRQGSAATPDRQERTLEEITSALTGPGVHVDAGPGSPRFSLVPGAVVKGLDYKTRSTPQPVWITIEGQRATTRTGRQPTFYFNQVDGVRVGRPGTYRFAATLHAAQVKGDKRLVEWPGRFWQKARDLVAEPDPAAGIAMAVEELSDGLFRVRPGALLEPGEFVILPDRARAEVALSLAMGTGARPRTALYAFGVDP